MKYLKLTLGILASLFVVVLIAVVLVCYTLFSPSRLTSLVESKLTEQLDCKLELDCVELTFFSTFPDFSLSVKDFVISDTLGLESVVSVERLYAEIDISELLFDNKIVVNGVRLHDGLINISVDSLGKANYESLFPREAEESESEETDESESEETDESESEETEGSMSLPEMMSFNDISFSNISLNYSDANLGMTTCIDGLNFLLNSKYSEGDAEGKSSLHIHSLSFATTGDSAISTVINNISLKADLSMQKEQIKGIIVGDMIVESFVESGEKLADNAVFSFDIPMSFNYAKTLLNLQKAEIAVNSLAVSLNGAVEQNKQEDLLLDMEFASNEWEYDSLLVLVPDSYKNYLEDIKKLAGSAEVKGKIEGMYKDSTMPLVTIDIRMHNNKISHTLMPIALNSVNADLKVFVDLNEEKESYVNIRKFSAKSGTTSISAKGTVNDLLDDISCKFDIDGDINLAELKPFIPSDIDVEIGGRMKGKIATSFILDDLVDMKLEKINANAKMHYTNLYVSYTDSLKIVDDSGTLSLNLPIKRPTKANEIIEISLKGTDIEFEQVGMLNANIKDPKVHLAISNPMDTTGIPSLLCSFAVKEVNATMDSLAVKLMNPVGELALYSKEDAPKTPLFFINYASDSLVMAVEGNLQLETAKTSVEIQSSYDAKQERILLKWNPFVKVDFNGGNLKLAQSDAKISIPAIKFDLSPQSMHIHDSRIIIDDSDFSLNGSLDNIRGFLNQKELLLGEFNYHSNSTNLDQLMALMNTFSSTQDSEEEEEKEVTTTTDSSSNPFIVPKSMLISFNSNISKAIFDGNTIEDIKGKLTVSDGRLVLEQIGFTSNAAKMLLTGVYRSDRRNHLYAGFNFHLLDIDVKTLINMIPMIDSLVPMLRSFEGKGQFHFAGETYLNSKYEPKMSTLRAAAAIEGKDLVLLDGETFSTISKYLMFSKKTSNIVDSISIEATVFRNEIDLYPFLISMDRWQGVISGRHNLDMNFNYHISVTDSPLPTRLGLDIKGNIDDMKFSLVKCRYKSLYNPEKQKVMDVKVLELKKLISESLKANLKPKKDGRL